MIRQMIWFTMRLMKFNPYASLLIYLVLIFPSKLMVLFLSFNCINALRYVRTESLVQTFDSRKMIKAKEIKESPQYTGITSALTITTLNRGPISPTKGDHS